MLVKLTPDLLTPFYKISNYFFQSQRKGTNQDAKELIALIDLYTELQQEFFEAVLEEEELEEESEELLG
jgi:hypothetical protein